MHERRVAIVGAFEEVDVLRRCRQSSAVACAVECQWNGPSGMDCERPSIVSVL